MSAENTGHLMQAHSFIVLGDCNEHCASSMENILLNCMNIPPKPFEKLSLPNVCITFTSRELESTFRDEYD